MYNETVPKIHIVMLREVMNLLFFFLLIKKLKDEILRLLRQDGTERQLKKFWNPFMYNKRFNFCLFTNKQILQSFNHTSSDKFNRSNRSMRFFVGCIMTKKASLSLKFINQPLTRPEGVSTKNLLFKFHKNH